MEVTLCISILLHGSAYRRTFDKASPPLASWERGQPLELTNSFALRSVSITVISFCAGNVIQLTLNKGGYILACSSECRVQPNNHTHSNLFQILNHPNISSQKIRSGNVVLFQSLRDESTWLDCSNPRNCVLSRCENLPGGDDNIAVSSDCQKHQFEIIGVNRKIGKLLNARNKFRLRHPSSGKYLNCDANNISDGGGIGTGRCTLLQLEGESQDCLPHENSDASETSADRCDGKGFDFTANKKI